MLSSFRDRNRLEDEKHGYRWDMLVGERTYDERLRDLIDDPATTDQDLANLRWMRFKLVSAFVGALLLAAAFLFFTLLVAIVEGVPECFRTSIFQSSFGMAGFCSLMSWLLWTKARLMW